MGAGSGGSSQTTTIKENKPFVVQDFYSPEFLERLGEIGTKYQERARTLTQRRQNLFNSLYTKPEYGNAPIYQPIVAPDGSPVDPNREVAIDPTSIIPQDPSFWKPPKIKGGGGGKKKRERDKYLTAVKDTNDRNGRQMGVNRRLRG